LSDSRKDSCSDGNNATLKMCQQQNTGSLYADKPSVNATPRPEIGLVTNRDPETVYCGYVNFKRYLTALSVAETIKRQ
jgi:hypothetical protein